MLLLHNAGKNGGRTNPCEIDVKSPKKARFHRINHRKTAFRHGFMHCSFACSLRLVKQDGTSSLNGEGTSSDCTAETAGEKVKLSGRLAGSFGWGRLSALLLLAFLIVLRVADPAFVESIRNQSFDLYQRVKPRPYVKQPVTIVDIDEASLEKYGQWPWPRTRLAQLLDGVTRMGSVAIAFDMVFSEPDRLSPALVAADNDTLSPKMKQALQSLPSNDNVFAAAIARSPVILGQTSVRGRTDKKRQSAKMVPVQHGFRGPNGKRFIPRFPDIVQNLDTLESAAKGRGVFTVLPDADGVFRRIPMVIMVDDHIRLALAPELLRLATGNQAFVIQSDAKGMVGIILAKNLIRTDENGRFRPYLTASNRARYISAGSILDNSVDASRLRGHLVLVGTSAVGLEDYRATPLGVPMPGVEIHAQILESILANQQLQRPYHNTLWELIAVTGIGLLAIAIVPYLGAFWSLMGAGILLLSYLATSYFLFDQHRFLLDPTFPIISTVLIFITLATANYFREEQRRAQIRGAFGQYISPALVDQLADNPEKLALGGETRELSVLFTDVRGFTTISESFRNNPQGLTDLMNKFLTVLSDAVLRHNGTIDKFMGDAVMAFWNAPLDNPKHADHAARAAIDMIADVAALNADMKEKIKAREAQGETGLNHHDINVGIGINSGDCVVGNMGSDRRFDYTALGDTVNIASRLEGQSKPYGIRIVLGSKTVQSLQATFALFEIDQIRVKGKNEAERIYGLFGDQDLAKDPDFIAAKAINSTLISCYRRQDWDAAYSALELLRDLDLRLGLELDDYLFMYETRISEFRANPPGPNWDGVYTATAK